MARRDNSDQEHTERDGRRRRGENDRQPDDVTAAVEQADKERQEAVERRQREYEAWIKRQTSRGEGGEKPPVTPFLLIRYSGTDLGVRPIPPGTPFWSSPDVWVESSDPGGNPVAGEMNFLHARIFNLGAFQAAPVQVDFYWADPSLGLGPATMNHIGTEWVEVPSLWSVDVRCNTPWIPTIVNNGHECVMVNCSNWIADPITNPFQPTVDRHVGQRNLHVIPGKAGMKISYSFQLTNVFPTALPVTVLARFDRLMATDAARGMSMGERGALAATFRTQERSSPLRLANAMQRSTPSHRVAQRVLALDRRRTEERASLFQRASDRAGGGRIVARLGEGYGVLDQPSGGKFAGELLAALDQFRQPLGLPEDERVLIKEVLLDPLTFRTLEVTIETPSDARDGEFFVAHLEQRAGLITLGGYAVVVQIAS